MTSPHRQGRDERTPDRADMGQDLSPEGYSTPEAHRNNADLVLPPLHHSDGIQDTSPRPPATPRDPPTPKKVIDTPNTYDAPESYANLDLGFGFGGWGEAEGDAFSPTSSTFLVSVSDLFEVGVPVDGVLVGVLDGGDVCYFV